MTETTAAHASEHLKRYLRQLTPQVRSRLLTELERLHLQGEDVPHSEGLIAALRAEFRNTGQHHYRAGNPSRYFFQPLEPFLVNAAPERAGSGRIARGTLEPIWSMITDRLLPSMAGDYIAGAGKAIAGNNLGEAQKLAATFQKKILTYLDGTLPSADGEASLRSGLEIYTSSHATLAELVKILDAFRAQPALAEFSAALPQSIGDFEGEALGRVLGPLNALGAKQASAVPFALRILSSRLKQPWQLIHLATAATRSRAAAALLATPYAVAVSMVLDQIDDKRMQLLEAFKVNHTATAREILTGIYEIERAVRSSIDLGESEWGHRLEKIMGSVRTAVDSEVQTIAVDHLHLRHVLESADLRPRHSWTERLGRMIWKGQATLVGG
jgi:hypothetical protein